MDDGLLPATRAGRPAFPMPAAHAAPASRRRGLAAALLSPREREVLLLLAKGFSVAEVGALLAISSHTVGTHVKKIHRKLAVHSRSEAVFEAVQLGLL